MMKPLALWLVIFMLLAFTSARAAFAQDILAAPTLSVSSSAEVLKKTANQFYKRCHQKPDATLSAAAQEEYCVCLSAQMYRKSLTDEERTYLATGEGVPMEYNRSIAEVYGQCIGIPGRAAMYNQCSSSYDAYKLVKGKDDLNALCGCMIQKMSDFWDIDAPAYLEAEVSMRRNIDDPLNHILRGRVYPVLYSSKRSECSAVYGRRD